MIRPAGVKINNTDIFEKYSLILSSYNISPPEVKQNFISVPGKSGDLDFSEALTGYPLYGNRNIKMIFGGKMNREKWHQVRSQILNAYHNKKIQIVFEEDSQFFWEGRSKIQDDFKIGQEVATFSIEVNAQPYKLEVRDGGSSEPWLWDPFSFISGVIRNYYQIHIDGEYTLNIIGREMPAIPIFVVSDAENLIVSFGGKEYELQNGSNKFYQIVTGLGENILIFRGKGVVTINYRGGEL